MNLTKVYGTKVDARPPLVGDLADEIWEIWEQTGLAPWFIWELGWGKSGRDRQDISYFGTVVERGRMGNVPSGPELSFIFSGPLWSGEEWCQSRLSPHSPLRRILPHSPPAFSET
jgi:hypothetical protein